MSSGRFGAQAWERCPAEQGAAASITGMTLADPQLIPFPNTYYWALRTEDPVHHDPQLGMYLVSRYEDLQTVLQDPTTFSLERGYNTLFAGQYHQELKDILIRDGGGYFPDLIMSDPPRHSRLRRLMEKAFTAHRMKLLEPAIAKLVGDLIDRFADRGRADGVTDFAIPMTISIMCEQLGLPHVDADRVRRWSAAYLSQLDGIQTHEQMLDNAQQIAELQHYLFARIQERQEHPREDMISDLVTAELDDEENPKLSFEEIVSLSRALLVGGNETTGSALGSLLFVLATEPAIAQQLYDAADDDRALTRFVEELIRIEPPVRALMRVTTREVELGGKTIPADSSLLLLFASANDDDRQFGCPRDFDPSRSNLGRHLSFGAGIHRCIGMALARMEVKVAAREIVRRLDDIRLAVPVETIRYKPSIAFLLRESLPLSFSRRQPASIRSAG